MKALAVPEASSSAAKASAAWRRLNRRVLAAGVDDPVRVKGLLEAAVQAFTDRIEGVECRGVFVAIPKQYGMPTGFCDFVA